MSSLIIRSGAVNTIEGYATPENDSGEGKLVVTFPSIGKFDLSIFIKSGKSTI